MTIFRSRSPPPARWHAASARSRRCRPDNASATDFKSAGFEAPDLKITDMALAALHNSCHSTAMPDVPPPDPAVLLAQELLDLTARVGARMEEDPFGNPVLLVALAITRRMDVGNLTEEAIAALIRHLRDAAFTARAERLAAYVGGVDQRDNDAILARLAQTLLRPDPNDSPVRWAEYRALVERPRFAAVFTAHPTFSLPPAVGHVLAEQASGRPGETAPSHRPPPITLEEEFTQAAAAIDNGRDAIDRFNAALIEVARSAWPDRWNELTPRPIILSTWVGYDTDGRTDIGWWDTLRLRLEMKRLQLVRLHAQVATVPDLAARVADARDAVAAQLAVCPGSPDPPKVAVFARTLIENRAIALTSPERRYCRCSTRRSPRAGDEDKLKLAVARAGLVSHGLALAHTHTRLNAAQLHNVVRQRLGIADPPEDPAHHRALFAAINAALDTVEPIPVDFGALLAEQASAARLMMTVAQIVKHVDSSVPVRFLIAETETGYTLLAALWLAKLFGVEKQIEISPLFETASALSRALLCWMRRYAARITGRISRQPGVSRCNSGIRTRDAMSVNWPRVISSNGCGSKSARRLRNTRFPAWK